MVIVELAAEELCHGTLATVFANGAAAAVVRCNDEVRRLWAQLLENPQEQLPWEAPLIDIARNYHGHGDITASLGDVYYFQPGHHSYIARKIELARAAEDGSLESRPSTFIQGTERFIPDPQTLSECWRLADRIMLALTPKDKSLQDCKIAVQRLKYQRSSGDFDRLAAMTGNALGRWGRLGAAIDVCRSKTAGPFRRKGLSDLMAGLMLVPLFRRLAHWINSLFARSDHHLQIDRGERIFEAPHYDLRYFSGLCGSRQNVRTEIYAEGSWMELPIGLDSITIIPGTLAQRAFGLQPTLHRVLHRNDDEHIEKDAILDDPRLRNVTLLIGAR